MSTLSYRRQLSIIGGPISNAPEMKSNNRMYTSSGFRTAVRVSNVSVNLHPDYRRVLLVFSASADAVQRELERPTSIRLGKNWNPTLV